MTPASDGACSTCSASRRRCRRRGRRRRGEGAPRPTATRWSPSPMLGHKADLAFMALGPDLWRLRRLQTALQRRRARRRRLLRLAHRVSRVRQGRARGDAAGPPVPAAPARGQAGVVLLPDVEAARRRRQLVHPALRRAQGADVRARRVGPEVRRPRRCRSITGSTGLDDYEWGVTLFAAHPDDLKEVVYTMRFDQASALYAEFGPFYTGHGRPGRPRCSSSSASTESTGALTAAPIG